MPVMTGNRVMEGTRGSSRVYSGPGAPVAGEDATQTVEVTGSPTGGTFTLAFRGHRTDPLDHDATAQEVEDALAALSTVGEGNVSVALSEGVYTVTFEGELGGQPVDLLTLAANALTGGTDPDVDIAHDNEGVIATGWGAAKGSLYTDSTNAKLYINTGTAAAPTWTVVGTQT